jgi:formamidopyrimidine-DNA glycosylase
MTIAKIEVLRQRAIASPQEPALFELALGGCLIEAWQRRGKYLMAKLGNGDGSDAGHWGVHLRMTGQFLWIDEPTPPCAHTRVRFWNPAGQELRFIDTRSFGQMWWVPPHIPPETVITGLARLGPEPFDPQTTAAYLHKRLQGSKRAIKNALLDQSLIAGVGNIYADESLFAAGIRPDTASGCLSLARLARLQQCLVEVLKASIGAGGTTFSDFRDLKGLNGNYGSQAWVYRRSGQPCRRCGNTIQRQRLGGRSSHWCPCCQT